MCYVKPMEDPLGVIPSKGNQEITQGKEKILLTSVGIEPTIRSTVTLPTELRGRTEKVGDNLGGESCEEKVRVHMNVVPCSTINTNGGTEN